MKEVMKLTTGLTLVASLLIASGAEAGLGGFFARMGGSNTRSMMTMAALCGYCGQDYCKDKWQKYSVTAVQPDKAYPEHDNRIRLVVGPKEYDIRHDDTRTFWGLFTRGNPFGLQCTKYEQYLYPLSRSKFSENHPHLRDVHVTSESYYDNAGPLEVEFAINESKCSKLKKDPSIPWLEWTCGDKLYKMYYVNKVHKIKTELVTSKEDVTEALKLSK